MHGLHCIGIRVAVVDNLIQKLGSLPKAHGLFVKLQKKENEGE
jgi:hypothetical protein